MKMWRFCAALCALSLISIEIAGAQASLLAMPALDTANLNRSVRACDDFYEFANGGWLSRNPIPAAYSGWGTFSELGERNYLVLKQILENAARRAKTTKDPSTRKLGTFYASCMDSTAADRAGIKPLNAELGRIGRIANRDQLLAEIATLHRIGFAGVFSFGSGSDQKNASQVIAVASQGGTTLPDREQYLRADSSAVALRTRYQAYAQKLFTLAGESSDAAAADAARVLSVETALAKASLPRVAMRDPNARYHPMSIAQADSLIPALEWRQFIAGAGAPSVERFNISTPDFFKALNTELTGRPLDDWKAYLKWRVIDRSAPSLGSAFADESFNFNRQLTGATQQLPRWRRCISAADRSLSDALGREYVKVAFTPVAKASILSMVMNLRGVLHDRILHADWMSEGTRQQALLKMDAFNQKVGYPDKWEDYRTLAVTPGPFINNVLAVQAYRQRKDLLEIGKPVDRTQWGMTTPTVNAYYSASLNEIVFPAGRMQPPFFSQSYDVAANYGGVAGTVGHEMSHGFDDQGRQYDAAGNLRDWWTTEDAKRYTARAKIVESQYGDYVAVDTLHLNGRLTLGENLADVVGLSIAYEAMERALREQPRPVIDGFTQEQRFFLAAAQARANNSRPERARILVATDPHSPGKFRVNGPLSNMPEFAAAFGCKPGDPMVRADSIRARIW